MLPLTPKARYPPNCNVRGRGV